MGQSWEKPLSVEKDLGEQLIVARATAMSLAGRGGSSLAGREAVR
jgi:hypothetical protein